MFGVLLYVIVFYRSNENAVSNFRWWGLIVSELDPAVRKGGTMWQDSDGISNPNECKNMDDLPHFRKPKAMQI
jgi:hypothetical protein